MKGHILAMFTGGARFEPPVTFPQSHIIHAGSIHEAHKIIKEGGYFVVNGEGGGRRTSPLNFMLSHLLYFTYYSQIRIDALKKKKTLLKQTGFVSELEGKVFL